MKKNDMSIDDYRRKIAEARRYYAYKAWRYKTTLKQAEK